MRLTQNVSGVKSFERWLHPSPLTQIPTTFPPPFGALTLLILNDLFSDLARANFAVVDIKAHLLRAPRVDEPLNGRPKLFAARSLPYYIPLMFSLIAHRQRECRVGRLTLLPLVASNIPSSGAVLPLWTRRRTSNSPRLMLFTSSGTGASLGYPSSALASA